jgi:hypothetical protein
MNLNSVILSYRCSKEERVKLGSVFFFHKNKKREVKVIEEKVPQANTHPPGHPTSSKRIILLHLRSSWLSKHTNSSLEAKFAGLLVAN